MKKTIIIGEAGVNHNGDILLAKKLIDVAADAGVNYVKFQTFKASKLVSKDSVKASYQRINTGNSTENQLQMLQKLELTSSEHYELIAYCKLKNINFFSTAFDLDSLDFLKELGFTLFKIPSGEITNLPYLKKVAKLACEIILSTGMCTMEEIAEAITVLKKNSKAKVTVLHCNTEYPTPFKDVNLLAMNEIKQKFNIDIGYSDHTLGIEVPIAAVALGAKVIEKHFTLDRNLPGPDHASSLEPQELKSMVTAIRNIEIALGSAIKEPTPSEINNIIIARKSIHLAVDKLKGDTLREEDLEMLVSKDLLAGHKLTLEDFT